MRVILFLIITVLSACTKTKVGKCTESPSTGNVCQAYFESWFYDFKSNSCIKKGYSGCNEVGCKTKLECDECAFGK